VLAVCFNRTLAPFIRGKIEAQFAQRSDRPLPAEALQVSCMNRLMYHLAHEQKVMDYVRIDDVESAEGRAEMYLQQLLALKRDQPARFDEIAFDAIYVDEGQDFAEQEFAVLRELCRREHGAEPGLYVFYDDAQNLYGRKRPNWSKLGLEMRGRSHVMTQCKRNTTQIIDAAVNVLYASTGPEGSVAPTREFFDLPSLTEKGLVDTVDGLLRVKFCKQQGMVPVFALATSAAREIELMMVRLKLLIEKEHVRPEDILILCHRRSRAQQIIRGIEKLKLRGVSGVVFAAEKKEKDNALCRRGMLTVSTVASAKGYDAYVTLLASANEFRTDVRGRACFYVGCTRAMRCLEVFAYERAGLAREFDEVVRKLGTATSAG
jgi:hypothetical protein